GGTKRHQAVGAIGDLPFDEVAEHLLVDRAVFEGRDQRGERSAKIRLGGHGTLPALNCRASTCGFSKVPVWRAGRKPEGTVNDALPPVFCPDGGSAAIA